MKSVKGMVNLGCVWEGGMKKRRKEMRKIGEEGIPSSDRSILKEIKIEVLLKNSKSFNQSFPSSFF